MRILRDTSDYVAKWVAERIGMPRGFSRNVAFGIVNSKDELISGLVYHNYEPEAGVIELSGAAVDRHWLTRDVLQFMYDYPFLDCHAQMLFQRNSAKNEHLNKQLRRWGYSEILIPRMKGRDEDGIVFTFTDDQWAAHPRNMRNLKRAA